MMQIQQPLSGVQYDFKLSISSQKFQKFIALLAHLKQFPLQCAPCICMECWSIISKDESVQHRLNHPKQVTPAFQDMKVATKQDII